MIEIREITGEHKQDIYVKNDPFLLWGRMIPSYRDEVWAYTVQEFPDEQRREMCFPDENYDFDEMCADTTFLGAYDGDICIGLLVLQRRFFKYLYISDLSVRKVYRRRGVGRMLIAAALQIARERNYQGISLTAQDNNLSACLFYVNTGFRIGGLDTEVYNGTNQQGKFDIQFYRDA